MLKLYEMSKGNAYISIRNGKKRETKTKQAEDNNREWKVLKTNNRKKINENIGVSSKRSIKLINLQYYRSKEGKDTAYNYQDEIGYSTKDNKSIIRQYYEQLQGNQFNNLDKRTNSS